MLSFTWPSAASTSRFNTWDRGLCYLAWGFVTWLWALSLSRTLCHSANLCDLVGSDAAGLAWETDENTLRDAFSSFGEVSEGEWLASYQSSLPSSLSSFGFVSDDQVPWRDIMWIHRS